jgi:hypothetical protein
MEFLLFIDFEQTELISISKSVSSESEHKDTERSIYNEIVVKQSSIDHAFTIYGPLAIQLGSVSFQNAMSCSDHKF